MKKIILVSTLFAGFILCTSLIVPQKEKIGFDSKTKVWDVLKFFGEPMPNHSINPSMKEASVDKGRDLVLKGITTKPGGGKINKQSKHFVCTSCHNVVQEDPDLSNPNPEDRLAFAQKNKLPFLQGTTLYGAVNRSSFYNGDYEKKYGKLVEPARNNLREAIQLCAVECSQGRKLNHWELESVLAYLWTLGLKLEDLNLSNAQLDEINDLANDGGDGKSQQRMRDLLKSRYVSGSPAHFVAPPSDRKKGNGLKGNPDNGALIYELSCQHCHKDKRYSYFNLDDSDYSFKHLNKHFPKYTRYSAYQVTRYGTPPMNGKKAYMPQYTVEKLSEQQLADLRAYVEMKAE